MWSLTCFVVRKPGKSKKLRLVEISCTAALNTSQRALKLLARFAAVKARDTIEPASYLHRSTREPTAAVEHFQARALFQRTEKHFNLLHSTATAKNARDDIQV